MKLKWQMAGTVYTYLCVCVSLYVTYTYVYTQDVCVVVYK